MHQAKAAHQIASHLRQHSQNKRVKIFHLLIASNFEQQISSKETWQMPDLKTSFSLSETEFKKGTRKHAHANLEVHTRWEGETTRSYGFSVARIKLRIHGTYSRIDHHMRTIKIWTWSSQCMCSTTEGTASQLVLSVLQTNGIWLIMGICNQSFWRKMLQGSWQGKGHFITECSLAVGTDTVTKGW